MADSLRGKVALVTGGSRGIGAAIARELCEAGAAVAVNYRQETGQASELIEALRRAGGKAIAAPADVSNAAAVTDMVARVKSELGPIDILVNNAGIAITRGVDD